MTTATRTDGRLTAARVAFIGFFGLALGWAGVLVAAVAVATERARNGDDVAEPGRHKTGSSGWWEQWRAGQSRTRAEREQNARRWLAEDREDREELTRRRREWVSSGAEPATEPQKPGYARRLGRAARRAASRRRVAAGKLRAKASDFKTGFQDGWKTASPNADKGFKEAAKTRPATTAVPDTAPVDAEILDDEPGNPNQAPEPVNPDVVDMATVLACGRCSRGVIRNGVCDRCGEPVGEPAAARYPFQCHKCGVSHPGFATAELAQAAGAEHTCEADQRLRGDSHETAGGAPAQPATESSTGSGDPNMAIPTKAADVKANTNPQAVDGDDHLDKITAGLGLMGQTLAQGDEHTDALMALARKLRAEAAAVMERAGDKATTATRQACDQAVAQAAMYEEAAAKVAEASAATAEQIDAADRGLDPGRHARDNLHTAGATGELLATASDG